MTSLELKFLVYEKWGSITAAARTLDCSRSQLSYCISRRRISPQLRERLARALNTTVDLLFGDRNRDLRCAYTNACLASEADDGNRAEVSASTDTIFVSKVDFEIESNDDETDSEQETTSDPKTDSRSARIQNEAARGAKAK